MPSTASAPDPNDLRPFPGAGPHLQLVPPPPPDGLVPGPATAAGVRDAWALYPDADAPLEPTPAMWRIAAEATEAMAAVGTRLEKTLAPLRARIRGAAVRRDELAARLAAHENADRRHGDDADAADAEVAGSEDRHRRFEGRFSVPTVASAVALAVMAAGEAPLAMIVFQVFGGDTLQTAAVVTSLAVASLLSAHQLGGQLKDWAHGRVAGRALTAWAVLTGVLVLGIAGVTVFMGQLRGSRFLDDQALLAGDGYTPASPVVAVGTFLAIQTLFIAIALVIGYRRHADVVEAAKQARRRRAVSAKALAKDRNELVEIETELQRTSVELEQHIAAHVQEAKELADRGRAEQRRYVEAFTATASAEDAARIAAVPLAPIDEPEWMALVLVGPRPAEPVVASPLA